MENKKIDIKKVLEKSRAKKQQMQTKTLKKTLGKKKNSAKFGKVNFNG